MKIQNTRSILKTIHDEKGIYRKVIAKRTNLASQTITNIVKELVDKKILTEYGAVQKKKGRNPTSLNINYGGFYAVTVAVTVQKLSVFLHALDGEVLDCRETIIERDMDVLNELKEILNDIKERYYLQKRIQVIMISVEGIVNETIGTVIEAKDIHWHNVDLVKELEFLKIPVFVRNDVNLIAHYEKINHKEDINFMVIKIDKGIGSALVVDRHVVRSTNSVAGEFGHVTVNSNEKRKCTCGKYNCLTRFISKSALEERYGKDYETIKTEVRHMNPAAIGLIEGVCDYMVETLSNIIILLDLDRIILTGCIIDDFNQIIYPRLDRKIRENLSYWVAFKTLEAHQNIELPKISSEVIIDFYFNNNSEVLFLWDNI
jgi:predicted NBD/HSP70 family sugar kinase